MEIFLSFVNLKFDVILDKLIDESFSPFLFLSMVFNPAIVSPYDYVIGWPYLKPLEFILFNFPLIL